MTAAETIKKIRLMLCLSKSEFAEALKLHRSAVTNYESGARKPRMAIIREIVKLAKKNKINVKAEDFFPDE